MDKNEMETVDNERAELFADLPVADCVKWLCDRGLLHDGHVKEINDLAAGNRLMTDVDVHADMLADFYANVSHVVLYMQEALKVFSKMMESIGRDDVLHRPNHCHFCGQPAKIIAVGEEQARVYCSDENCGAAGPSRASEIEAIKAWNGEANE